MDITVRARDPMTRTELVLVRGATYRFESSGHWWDWFVRTTAVGYEGRLVPLKAKRVVPGSKWFSLIGCIDGEVSTAFDIGRLIETGTTYTAVAEGRLYLFANDVPGMFWNNWGRITVRV